MRALPQGDDVVISGIGIVSPLGCGVEEVLRAMPGDASAPGIDWERYAPYGVRRAAPFDDTRFLRKASERRVMSDMMLHAVEAAGQALTAAALLGDAERLARLDLLVAAGMSARDTAADARLLDGARRAAAPAVRHNEMMQSEYKPTLFLAQLSNLVAGNLSIVFGIKGSSRTISGEELAGAQCLDVAVRQIRSGQRDIVLIGGCFSADRPEIVAGYAAAGMLRREQDDGDGTVLASMAVFLVLESARSAAGRTHMPLARVAAVRLARSDRAPAALSRDALVALTGARRGGRIAVIDGSPGGASLDEETRLLLAGIAASSGLTLCGHHPRSARFGHGVDASALLSTALGALALAHPDAVLQPGSDAANDAAAPELALCCDWGLRTGETEILLEKAA